MRRWVVLLVLLLVVAACNGDSTEPEPDEEITAQSASEAVSLLISYFEVPDFDAAARLGYPGQAALASLAEGASFAEVAAALRDGDDAIAANFWAGFAQGAGSFLSGGVEISDGQNVTIDRVEFGVANVMSGEVGERTVITRTDDGHRVDLFASFGAGLAPQMIPAVERLLNVRNEDSTLILGELNEIVPSLVLASRQEWVPPAAALEIVRLVELITRTR